MGLEFSFNIHSKNPYVLAALKYLIKYCTVINAYIDWNQNYHDTVGSTPYHLFIFLSVFPQGLFLCDHHLIILLLLITGRIFPLGVTNILWSHQLLR